MDDTEKPMESKGYTKVDRRFTKTETETEGEADTENSTQPPKEASPDPSSAPATEPQTQEPEKASDQQPPEPQTLAELGVYPVIRFCLSLLVQQAWIALGIIAPPGGETKMNLPEAKVAIDTAAVLVEKLQPDLDAAEKKELEATLANLRINFVQRAG